MSCSSGQSLLTEQVRQQTKNIFEIVASREKFGIESKASLNKTEQHPATSQVQTVQNSKNP
jgi:hypothetical protein